MPEPSIATACAASASDASTRAALVSVASSPRPSSSVASRSAPDASAAPVPRWPLRVGSAFRRRGYVRGPFQHRAARSLGLVCAGAGVMLVVAATACPRATAVEPPRVDLAQWLFSALFTAAVDPDVERLQWVDARARLGCGPGTQVRVDGRELVPELPVPDHAFELEWSARACRPFGAGGPVLEGTIRYLVARDDWGFSARMSVADDARFVDEHGTHRLAGGSAATPIAATDRSSR